VEERGSEREKVSRSRKVQRRRGRTASERDWLAREHRTVECCQDPPAHPRNSLNSSTSLHS
jgi:hypothetical protein